MIFLLKWQNIKPDDFELLLLLCKAIKQKNMQNQQKNANEYVQKFCSGKKEYGFLNKMFGFLYFQNNICVV